MRWQAGGEAEKPFPVGVAADAERAARAWAGALVRIGGVEVLEEGILCTVFFPGCGK